MPSIRFTSLYGSQPLSVVFAGQTVTFGADFKVSMGPRHDLSFCACKTEWLASELLVFMSHSPHVWFLDAKERLLDRINKSLWVPDITCLLCMWNSVISNWITSLSGSQPSSVVFACKRATFGPELQVSMGPTPHLSFCAYKTWWLTPEILVPLCHSTYLCFFHAKQSILDQNYKSLWVPDVTCRFVCAKLRDLHQINKSLWVSDLTCCFVHAKQRD